MNLSSAVDRIQQLGDLIEKLIKQSNEMRDRVIGLEENVDATTERVATVEAKVERQTALLETLARQQDVDPESVYEEAGLDRPPEQLAAERTAGEDGDGEGADDGTGGADDGDAGE